MMGISYSQVTICFIFLCCEKGAYSNAYNRFNSYSFEPFLLESIVRQTGRGHPDTYGGIAQMERASALQAEGRGFESHYLHQVASVNVGLALQWALSPLTPRGRLA